MTEPRPPAKPPMDPAAYHEFQRQRLEAASAAGEDVLVPVEGGEPMLAEEQPPAKRSETF